MTVSRWLLIGRGDGKRNQRRNAKVVRAVTPIPRRSHQSRQDDPRTVLHWYDFLCPFCYVGQHRTAILARHGFHVVELPLQAHPDIPPGGIPAGPRSGPMYAMLEREARAAGLALNWPPHLPDTRRALAAAEWVRRHQPDDFPTVHGKLFEAHFVLGENLEDPAVIDAHARGSGVDVAALHATLADGSAMAAVAEPETIARGYGVQGTPAWLLAQRLISGLLPAAEFERRAERAEQLPR
jgi:predicted DsbA family dithiol-disulfide isomerase